jgi:hypothetical protein
LGIAALADPTAKLKGVVLSGRPKDIQEARETMLLVNQTALTKYSRDELCPPRTDHVLFLGIRDVMAMPFCCNYSPRVGWSRGGNLGGGWCQGVADGGESVAAVAAAGFDN